MKFVAWLRRQAEVCTSIGILLGGFAAVIVFFGGSFPPWVTPSQAREAQEKSVQIQNDTATILNKLTDKVDMIGRRVNQQDCSKLNSQMDQAAAVLARNPNDALAKSLRDTTSVQMRAIPGCVPF